MKVILAAAATLGIIGGTVGLKSALSEHASQPAASTSDSAPIIAAVVAGLPAVETQVPDEIAQGLLQQGIRINGEGDAALARVSEADLYSAPNVTHVPSHVYLLRVTDDQFGQLAEPGPNGSAVIDKFVENRLVWVAIYPKADVPVGGGYITGFDGNGNPTADTTTGPDFGTIDMFVIHDASTGKFVEAGSI